MWTRRAFLRGAGTAGVAAIATLRDDGVARIQAASATLGQRTPEDVAQDEYYWAQIQQAFTLDRTFINLNNGYTCPSPRVVHEALKRYLDMSNQSPYYYMNQTLERHVETVRLRLARTFGCDPEEMAITRNASEALQIAQLGIDLEPGDEVVTTTQDYGRMLNTWRQRARRDGITLTEFSFPVPPPSMADLAARFERAITPRTKIFHMCHITNTTGQIFPVREICRLARSRGIKTIVDGAHAFAHFPFTVSDLECDYYGTSLHKWLFAPVGTGFLYVRRELIPETWPMQPASERQDDDIRKFEAIGTHPAANHNAIAEALTFLEATGIERKAARLRYLRDRWAKRLMAIPRVKLFTSLDPAQSCGLGTFGLEGVDVRELASYLRDEHRIHVAAMNREEFQGLRITPNLYTTLSELDEFAEAVEKFAETRPSTVG